MPELSYTQNQNGPVWCMPVLATPQAEIVAAGGVPVLVSLLGAGPDAGGGPEAQVCPVLALDCMVSR